MPPSRTPPGWGIVIPVKVLAVAKSRLGGYGNEVRQQLALAFACDVVVACVACPGVVSVLVVTDDAYAAHALASRGASVTADSPGAGLNAALVHGVALLRAELGGGSVAAVSSDLPCLRPEDLAAALAHVPALGRAFVADASARGTTVLAAGATVALLPAYGAGSRARHLASGAVELAAPPALRQDVDTPHDLQAARTIGVGAHTLAVLDRLR